MRGKRMAKLRAVGADRQDDLGAQAQQVPLRWRVAKPAPTAVVVQAGTASTVAVDPVLEVAEYYQDRAQAFRKRRKLPHDNSASDERLF
jgi:hypothetical protein